MILKDFLPAPELQEFVRCYRIVHFKFDRQEIIPVKAYPPKAENILHFFLRDRFAIETHRNNREYQAPVTFIGQRTFTTRQINESDFLNFQIVFQPTAVFRLTGIPGHELLNKFLPAQDIFSKTINETHEQLLAANGYSDLLNIGEKFVRTLIRSVRKDSLKMDILTSQSNEFRGNVSLKWLARESCLCTKQYKRRFFERTGVNPKLFERIIRFNKAYNIRNRYPEKSWFEISIECGYYDYQHLVKDYKDFTGRNPNQFHLLESKSPERILGLADEVYRSRLAT